MSAAVVKQTTGNPCDKHPGHSQQTDRNVTWDNKQTTATTLFIRGAWSNRFRQSCRTWAQRKKIKCLKKSHRLLTVFQNIKCISLITTRYLFLFLLFLYMYKICLYYYYMYLHNLLHLIFFAYLAAHKILYVKL